MPNACLVRLVAASTSSTWARNSGATPPDGTAAGVGPGVGDAAGVGAAVTVTVVGGDATVRAGPKR